jgi:hypothetical protein
MCGDLVLEEVAEEKGMLCRCNLELTMTNAAKLARHRRKGQLAERIEELRDWRFQEAPESDPVDALDLSEVCARIAMI